MRSLIAWTRGHRARLGYLAGLALALAIGLGLRAPLLSWAAASYRTTEAFSIEEVENVRISTGMLHEQSANPHAFEYPSLFYSLSVLVEAPVRAARGADWTAYLVAVRCLSLGFGLIAIVLAAELARRLGGKAAGLLTATIMATDRTMIEMSTTAKPNMVQIAFVLGGFLALTALARSPRLRTALLAAGLFALAAASKWLGALGLVGLAVAPSLALASRREPAARQGVGGLVSALARGLRERATPASLAAPLVVFGLVLVAAMPFSLLSPREFAYGLGQTFFAQAANRRALPPWISFEYLRDSLGSLAILLCLGGVAWGVHRLLRWDASARANGVVLVFGWALVYGLLVLFVFARLPSYVDLWIPFLAVLAGLAWAGDEGWIRPRGIRFAVAGLALVAGLSANGSYARDRQARFEGDTRIAAGRWLAEHADRGDSLLADLGVFVPDSLDQVRWNWWGNPPRLLYDETRTWGHDPIWTDNWYGGHRQLLFMNARWVAPESLLVARPRFVVTSADWVARRRAPGRSTWAATGYDHRLADGSAGYARVARFTPGDGVLVDGPEILVFARSGATAPESSR